MTLDNVEKNMGLLGFSTFRAHVCFALLLAQVHRSVLYGFGLSLDPFPLVYAMFPTVVGGEVTSICYMPCGPFLYVYGFFV